MLQKLTEDRITTYLSKRNEKCIFNLGDVLIYNEDDFEIKSYNPPKVKYTPFLFKAVTPCGKVDEMLFYSNNECVEKTKICLETIAMIRKRGEYVLNRIPNYSKH